jgi:hypothetical protein
MDFEQKLKDDIGWLMLICPERPTIEQLEPAAQALGIANSLKKNPIYDQKDIMKLAMAGCLGAKARQVDEKRFQETLPYAFVHLANFMIDPKDDGQNYQKLIKKMSIQ